MNELWVVEYEINGVWYPNQALAFLTELQAKEEADKRTKKYPGWKYRAKKYRHG